MLVRTFEEVAVGKRKPKEAPQSAPVTSLFRQVVVVAVQGIGAGAQEDAGQYRDRGADTLAHVANYMGGLDLKLLQWLGLGNVTRIRGVAPAEDDGARAGGGCGSPLERCSEARGRFD